MIIDVERKDLEQLFRGISALQAAIHVALAKRASTPLQGSPADIEARDSTRGEQARAAHLDGLLAFVVADDHLTALAKIASPPASTAAPATCARAVLESAAICSWLCDPKVDVVKRVARAYAYRYEGYVQQNKISTQHDPSVEDQIVAMEAEAQRLGYPRIPLVGPLRGVGQRMPNTTELIRTNLKLSDEHGFTSDYRFLSGIAHGHSWAVRQFGFKVIDNSDSTAGERFLITKDADPSVLAYCGVKSVLAHTIAIRRLFQLFGWEEIMPLVVVGYEQMGIRSIFNRAQLDRS